MPRGSVIVVILLAAAIAAIAITVSLPAVPAATTNPPTHPVPVHLYYEVGTGQQWLVATSPHHQLWLVGAVTYNCTTVLARPMPMPLHCLTAVEGPVVGYYTNTLHITSNILPPHIIYISP